MTLRMKLARWIGGEKLDDEFDWLVNEALNACDGRHAALTALETIAALETPKANATVRKMARIAREALK